MRLTCMDLEKLGVERATVRGVEGGGRDLIS